ncbi:hypothetical protein V1511DRAFT_495659 [Dipodascopsis uninucleata]
MTLPPDVIRDDSIKLTLDLLLSMRQLSSIIFDKLLEASEGKNSTLIEGIKDTIGVQEENGDFEEKEANQGQPIGVEENFTKPEDSEFVKLYKMLMQRTIQLRGMNRNLMVLAKDSKSVIADRRTEIDRLQLELQNMYYRQKFLRAEIARCNAFPSSHTQVDFVSLEQFYADHPDFNSDGSDQNAVDITTAEGQEGTRTADYVENRSLDTMISSDKQVPDYNGEVEMTDAVEDASQLEHKLMLARLKDERQRRQKLENQKKELNKIRLQLVAENKKRKEDLECLDAQLQKFIESAMPIQAVFDKY